jgi:hypothetical protein
MEVMEKTAGIIFKDGESAWWKLRLKTLENRDKYGSKYLAGVIGEKEGRKWLTENGYEVFEFGSMEYRFEGLENVVDRLKRRRKQEYIEEDKIHINTREHKLKGIFGEKFEEMRQFYKAFYQLKEKIRKAPKYRMNVGSDFIVKKDGAFAFVEVKANQSMLSKYQRMGFKIAKRYGFKTFVLRVKVESNTPKDIHLIEF